MRPRMLMTIDESGKLLPVSVRVGQAVDIVAQVHHSWPNRSYHPLYSPWKAFQPYDYYVPSTHVTESTSNSSSADRPIVVLQICFIVSQQLLLHRSIVKECKWHNDCMTALKDSQQRGWESFTHSQLILISSCTLMHAVCKAIQGCHWINLVMKLGALILSSITPKLNKRCALLYSHSRSLQTCMFQSKHAWMEVWQQ